MHTQEREWPKSLPAKSNNPIDPKRLMKMKVLIREAWGGKASSAIYLDATTQSGIRRE
jgi:hypothetical protein